MREWIELRFKNNILNWDVLQEAIDALYCQGGGTVCLVPNA